MEAKLREYRAIRRRKELIEQTKTKIDKTKDKLLEYITPQIFKMKEDEILLMEDQHPEKEIPIVEDNIDVASELSEAESIEEPNPESWRYFLIKWSIYSVSWLTLFMVFLKLQFGAVFFAFSLLFGIYFNTRTSPKKKGEVSAYSVFNRNCKSIDGTLKAEQFEREIRYGAGAVR